jgi:hypothetical protein
VHWFAQLNVGKVRYPLEHPEMAEFTSMLGLVNQMAELSHGFIWRLTTTDGMSSSYVAAYDDPLMLINMSVWTGPEAFKHYVYKSGHAAYLRRRTEWFERSPDRHAVCWWISQDTLPDVSDALRRLDTLRAHGPTDEGFGINELRDPPSAVHG